MKTALALACALMIGTTANANGLIGNADNGERIFNRCKSCHQVGEGARHRTGPVLNGVVGRAIASADGYDYSEALKALGEPGAIWTQDALDAFLTRPRDFAKGTRMIFNGLARPQDRADVIAYLASFSTAVEANSEFALAPEVLNIQGDAEYGEYLASECSTCHGTGEGSDGIPAIVGLETGAFVTAMHAYREGHREHPVMQMIAGRLSDDEIAALAAYFKDLER